MSEMLGNQYFLARNYNAAAEELEDALQKHPSNNKIMKKLIVCFSQTGEIDKALILFNRLIIENIKILIDSSIQKDDCPCSELIPLLESKLPYTLNEQELKLRLGILWLYCDIKKSASIFEEISNNNNENIIVKEIHENLKEYLATQKINSFNKEESL